MITVMEVIEACIINEDGHQLKLLEGKDPNSEIPIASLQPSIQDTLNFTEGVIFQGINAWEKEENSFFGLTN